MTNVFHYGGLLNVGLLVVPECDSVTSNGV